MSPDLNISLDPPTPYHVAMHLRMEFRHTVSLAENMDAATDLVKTQVEMFIRKARDEALAAGFEVNCDYMVAY